MYYKFKKMLPFITIVVMVIGSFITVLAQESVAQDSNADKEIHALLNKWSVALNTKNLDSYLSVFDNEMKKALQYQIINSSEANRKYLEFYSVDMIKVKDVKELTDKQVEGLINLDLYKNVEHKIYYFYVDAKIKDNMDNKYLVNGENFRIAVLTVQDGKWVISQLSTAPVPYLVERGISLGSKKESDIVSPYYVPDEVVEPTSIRVMLYMSHNYNYYNVGYKDVVSMNFQHYFRNVLPNEWDSDIVVPDSNNDSTKLYQSLRAGALMVKSFGWYHTTYPWNPSAGADVNDQYTQFYYVGTDDKRSQDGKGVYFDWGLMCQDAFNYVYNKVVWDKDIHTAYFTSYGQERQDRTYQYDRDGKTYSQIIYLEYPNSIIELYTE